MALSMIFIDGDNGMSYPISLCLSLSAASIIPYMLNKHEKIDLNMAAAGKS